MVDSHSEKPTLLLQKAMQLEQKLLRNTAEQRELIQELVSDYRQLKEKLDFSDENFRALLSAAKGHVAIFDADARYCNVFSHSGLISFPDLERIGKSVYDILPPETASWFDRCIKKALMTGEIQKLEYALPVGDASSAEEAWFSACIIPKGDNQVIWIALESSPKQSSGSTLKSAEKIYHSITSDNNTKGKEDIDSEISKILSQLCQHDLSIELNQARSSKAKAEINVLLEELKTSWQELL